MPRRPRIVIPNLAYHVTQRGNYRQQVFKGDQDYTQYLSWFNEYAQKYNLDILAFCLMSNHVHFVLVPAQEESLACTFNTVHMRYAQYHNRKKKVYGHLWQGRFFSCILDEAHLYRAIRYVERNPVRAKIVKKAWDYPWSSARTRKTKEERRIMKNNRRCPLLSFARWKSGWGKKKKKITSRRFDKETFVWR